MSGSNPATDPKSVQSDRKRNSEKENIEIRRSMLDVRRSIFSLFREGEVS